MIFTTYTLKCDGCGHEMMGYDSKSEALESARISHWDIVNDETYCLACRAVREVNILLKKYKYVSSGYIMSDGSQHVRRISEKTEYYIPISSTMSEVQSEWSQMMRDSNRTSELFPVEFFARPSTKEEIRDWTTA